MMAARMQTPNSGMLQVHIIGGGPGGTITDRAAFGFD